MTQEFYGPVGDVAGRDVIKFHYANSRLLTGEERRTLNDLVKPLTENFGECGQQIWISIHKILGIENTETMHLDHYKSAEAILHLLLENAELRCDTSVEDNDTALRFQLQQKDATLQIHTHRINVLEANAWILRQANTDLKSYNNQQTEELRRTASHLQLALDQMKLPPAPCTQCKIAQQSRVTERKRLLASVAIAALASVSAIFSAFNAQAHAVKAKEAEARSQLCQFEGKRYSVGSVMNTQDLSNVRCAYEDKYLPPMWVAIPTNANAKRKVGKPNPA